MTTPTAPDVEAEANRQLHRRIAGWLMWPLSVVAAFAVGFAVVGQHTSAHGSTPPTVATPLATSGAHTAPSATPNPTVTPATTTVGAPAPQNHAKTKVVQATDTVAPAVTTAPKPPAAQAPAPSTQPAPTTTTAAPTSPPPLLSICLGDLRIGC